MTESSRPRRLSGAGLAEAISALDGKVVVPLDGGDEARDRPVQGRVLAVGPRAESNGTPVSVGDTVIYSKHGGTPVAVDGKDYLVLSADDVLIGSRVTATNGSGSRGAEAKRAELRADLEALRLSNLPHGI